MFGSLLRRRNEMLFEVARPVRGSPTRGTPCTETDRSLEVTNLHPEGRQGWQTVHDDATAVTGVSIESLRNPAATVSHSPDRSDVSPARPSPRVRCPKHRPCHRLTERTAADQLLRVHTDDSIPRVVESNLPQRLVGWPPPTLGLRPCTWAPVAANEGLCRHPHRILVDFSAVR